MVTENTFKDRLVKVGDLDTVRGAAEDIGVVPTTISLWVQAGLLPSVRFGNCIVVHMRDVYKVHEEMKVRRTLLEAMGT